MNAKTRFHKLSPHQKRKSGNRGFPKKTFLIVCEGEKTEPNYFKSFRLTTLNVKVVGCGMNTYSLINETIRLKTQAIKEKNPFDQVWCVFDRDSFPAVNINRALVLAETNDIKVAFSNEAFEVWYLLHFCYFNTGVSRDLYAEKLTNYLKQKYKKNSDEIYDKIIDKQAIAIRNAENLLKQYLNHNPEKDNPSTTIHKLVIELNKFI